MSIFDPPTSTPSPRRASRGEKMVDPDQGEKGHLYAMIFIALFILGLIGLAFLLPDIS